MKKAAGSHSAVSCAGLAALVLSISLLLSACSIPVPAAQQSTEEATPQPSEYGVAEVDDTTEAPQETEAGSVPQTTEAEAAATASAAQTESPAAEPTEETTREHRDVMPPRISGAQDITVEEGGTVSYKKGVTVTDDQDPDVKLEIDNSAVDLNTPGDYPVVYSATDAAGNTRRVRITVHVTQKIATEEDFEKLHRLAKNELDAFTWDGMSDLEELWAIFWHVKYNMKYVNGSDKTSWVREAIRGFEEGTGDCFTYYAVMKALLEEAGYETVDMTRLGGEARHFWSLVKYKDNWYHIDACPRSADHGKYWYCFLRTDAQVAEFTEIWGEDYYYVYDESLCPRTPEEPLHLDYDINGEGHDYYDEDYE